MEGVNLPWVRYGIDFGANLWSPNGGAARTENQEALCRHFLELKNRGITIIRWFLLCDGRAGIRFSANGRPAGPDDHLFADIDAALGIAADCGLKIIFVLLDFLWFADGVLVNGVQVGGRSEVVADSGKQRALRTQIVKPILKRFGRSPVILAWDIVNEPEWATKGFNGGLLETAVSFPCMRRFLKRTVRQIHRHTRQFATVGLANAAGFSLVRDIGLDFYQVHWYDRWEEITPLERPVPDLNLDRPLLLGEFPTKNSARPPETIIAISKKSGYCGALAWSLLGTDCFTGMGDDREPRTERISS